jgi:general secretion pathway protein K
MRTRRETLGGCGGSGRCCERGAALLVAITSIAILTAVSVDLAYNTRVSLQMAANARDELRATYLAKSAVSMSRLVLNFQQRLDLATGGTSGAGGQASKSTTGQAAAGQPPLSTLLGGAGGGATLAIRLWEMVPIDSSAAALFLGGGARETRDASAPTAAQGAVAPEGTRRAFGDVEGSFHATIEDEERKINLRQFDGLQSQSFPFGQTMRLAQLVRDPKWDFLFDEDDANGFRVSRKDLFGAIKDWEDDNELSSTFTSDPLKPFEAGFGDENYLYDRLADRYKAKNAPFDSQDELYMVGGVSDAFMAAFGDKLTIYPDMNATINVNTDVPAQLMMNALAMSDPPGLPQQATLDPAFLTKLQAALALLKPLPFMTISPLQFANMLQALGVRVKADFTSSTADQNKNPFGDRSKTFHIRAVGVAGDVQKTIDAVVTFDRRAEGLAQDQGRLLHWREE